MVPVITAKLYANLEVNIDQGLYTVIEKIQLLFSC